MAVKLTLACLMLALSPLSHALSSLTSKVSSHSVMVGEEFTLVIQVNDTIIDTNSLDISGLKPLFTVHQNSVSRNNSIYNGVVTRTTTWTLRIVANKKGSAVIPALSLNGVSSNPIVMSITALTSTTLKNKELMLESELNSNVAYVGQQLLYKVKLYVGVSLLRAELVAPQLQGAEITQLGEDQDSSEIVDGKRYRIITRFYNIRPEKAGEFEFTAAIFRGDISVRTSSYRSSRSTPVTLIGENKKITVRPIPDNFPGEWLVSDMVVLQDDWHQQAPYIVGQPITRTITLSVANAAPEQLPNVALNFGDNVQAYPDKLQSQQRIKDNVLIAQSIQRVALVPTLVGDLQLPEIKVPWFNSQTNQVEWARIGAKTITVIADKNSPVSVPVAVSGDGNTQRDHRNITAVPTSKQHIQASDTALQFWRILCVVLAGLLLVAMIIIFRRPRIAAQQSMPLAESSADEHDYHVLRQALTSNDVAQVSRLMPLWLMRCYQLNITELIDIDPAMSELYQQLTIGNYGKDAAANIDCKPLQRAIS